VSLEPEGKSGEIAFIVSDKYQHFGLGTKMVDYAIEICKDMKVEKLYAIMLPDNYRAINLMKKMGFSVKYLDDGTARATLDLREEEQECSDMITPKELSTNIPEQVTRQTVEQTSQMQKPQEPSAA
ncbi:GNAT family N-acetyltransferase, partial [Candidatus Bathyarchaeota archaeon]|nr:GNAT family N-acetyltransferase [Candidatus Bathyarchaeota archaeon]